MKLSIAAKNLPSVDEQRPRRKSPRSGVNTDVVNENIERSEQEEEMKLFKSLTKLEEKMDDLLSKTKLPEDPDAIDTEILHNRAKKYLEQSQSRTAKMYERYQHLWKGYCLENMIAKDEECDDQLLKNFFIGLEQKYASSTLWVVYSCINSYFVEKYGKNLNSFARLSRFLKQKTYTYVTKKSKVLSPEQMEKGLKMCMNNKGNDHNLTHLGVTVSILYFGLLRCCDATKLELDDVTIEETGRVVINFEHARKRINHGFKFYVPAVYGDLFKTYASQLKKEQNGQTRFLKNWNIKSQTRVQNTGRDKVKKAIKDFCKLLGISDEEYTSHGFRRSAATNLADAGVTLVNLKRHGQWSADSSA